MATTKLTVIVPEELHRQARAVAALKGENISNVVREALAEYVTSAMQPAVEEPVSYTHLTLPTNDPV